MSVIPNIFFLRGLALSLILCFGLAGCDHSSTSGGHDHDEHVDHDEHGGPGHEGDHTIEYTHYSDLTELFVAFPPLVVNQSSTFAAHVTRLADYQPLASGMISVLLRKDERTVARFRVREPARRGLFTPTVTPKVAGEFQLVVEVQGQVPVGEGAEGQSKEFFARHNIGTVTVFANADSAVVDQPKVEGDIHYSKEQQWDHPFAAERVRMLPLRASVAGFATVRAAGDASATIRAPADGYYTAATVLLAGQSVSIDTSLGYLIPRLGEGTDIGRLMVDLERARSQLTLARRDVERLQSLVEQGAIPRREMEVAQHALEVAEVELQSAQSRVTQQSGTSSEAGIALRSPVAGEVVAVNVQPGAFVSAGDSLFTVVDPSRRWLEVGVPEKFSEGLSNASGAWLDSSGNSSSDGQSQSLILDASRGARIVQVNSLIDPQSRTASVTVEYPRAMGPTSIGARYRAHVFTSEAKPRLAIPRSATIDDGGRPVVYVQTGGETFTRRNVTLGIVDGDRVEVVNGVEEGERVVSTGAYYVKLAAAGGDEIGHGHAH